MVWYIPYSSNLSPPQPETKWVYNWNKKKKIKLTVHCYYNMKAWWQIMSLDSGVIWESVYFTFTFRTHGSLHLFKC